MYRQLFKICLSVLVGTSFTLFLLDVIFEGVIISLVSYLPYLISSMIGCLLGGGYAHLFYRAFAKYSYWAAVVPCVLIATVGHGTGIYQMENMRELCVSTAFLVCSITYAECQKKDLNV